MPTAPVKSLATSALRIGIEGRRIWRMALAALAGLGCAVTVWGSLFQAKIIGAIYPRVRLDRVGVKRRYVYLPLALGPLKGGTYVVRS